MASFPGVVLATEGPWTAPYFTPVQWASPSQKPQEAEEEEASLEPVPLRLFLIHKMEQ